MYLSAIPGGIRRLLRYRHFLRNLVIKDLKIKYRGSYFGVVWSLLNPLALIVVYGLVFRYIFRSTLENVPLLIVTGVLPWMFFSGSMLASPDSVLDNADLVRKAHFPRAVLPLATIVCAFIQFLISLLAFLPAILYWKGALPKTLLLFPLVVGYQWLLILGIALFLSAATVFFKDIRYLVEVSLTPLFWATPVVYTHSLSPDWIAWVNPLFPFFSAYQDVVFYERIPSGTSFLLMTFWALLALLVGGYVFWKTCHRFAEEI